MRPLKTYDVNGDLLTMLQMCDLAGCTRETMRDRLLTWSPADAVAMGAANRRRRDKIPAIVAARHRFRGQMLTAKEVAAVLGIGASTVRTHIRAGDSLDTRYPFGWELDKEKSKIDKKKSKPDNPPKAPKMRKFVPTPLPKSKRAVRLDAAAPIVGKVPKAECRLFVDLRCVVGPVPSVVSPDECRPWARAATS